MTDFTEGPWTFEGGGSGEYVVTSSPDKPEIAIVYDINDAHLIAAARDLYEAVEETRRLVVDCSDSGFTNEKAVTNLFLNNGKITQALKKARGE